MTDQHDPLARFVVRPIYHHVFKDFPLADIPAIPAGWTDVSWHNDSCPAFGFVNAHGETMRVFVDYADASRRECAGVPRFGLATEDGCPIFETDNWDALLTEAAKPRFPVSLEGDVVIGSASCAERALIVAEEYLYAYRMSDIGWAVGKEVSFGEWIDDDGETVNGWIVPLMPQTGDDA